MQLASIASTRVSKRRMHYSIVFDSSFVPEYFETVFDVVYANSEDETFETTKTLNVSSIEQIGNAVIVYGDLVFDDVEDVFRVTVSTTISVRKVVINYEEFDGAGGYTLEKDVDDVVDTPALRPPIPRQEDYDAPWFGTPIGDSVSNVDTSFVGTVVEPVTHELIAVFNGPVYHGLGVNNVYQTLGTPIAPVIKNEIDHLSGEETSSLSISMDGLDSFDSDASLLNNMISEIAMPSGGSHLLSEVSLFHDIISYRIPYEKNQVFLTYTEDFREADLDYFGARLYG